MNKFFFISVLTLGMVFSFNVDLRCQKSNSVLLFIRDGSGDLDYTLRSEVGVMKEILEQSGFTVVIATVSGKPLTTDSIEVIPDLNLSNVKVADYAGVILPCMHAGASLESIDPEAVLMIKQAVLENIPIAVQHAAIMILAETGLLKGKQYAYHEEVSAHDFPNFEGSVYQGRGVVKDGNIITSGICPYLGEMMGIDDGTEQLTRFLIAAINEINRYF